MEILSEVDEAQCLMISLWAVRTRLGSHNCARELSLVQSILSGCHSLPRMHCVPIVLSAGKNRSEF